jgi:hypothetical protein
MRKIYRYTGTKIRGYTYINIIIRIYINIHIYTYIIIYNYISADKQTDIQIYKCRYIQIYADMQI